MLAHSPTEANYRKSINLWEHLQTVLTCLAFENRKTSINSAKFRVQYDENGKIIDTHLIWGMLQTDQREIQEIQ